MCLGLFLFREGMQREFKIARTLERIEVEEEEGKQIKVVNIRGRERIFESIK
jgi:hypothetical protein